MEKKNENHHHILHIPIDLGSKFRLQRIFQKKKGNFRWKTEKRNIITEYFILALAEVPIFSLNWHFGFLDQICPKRVFSV